MPPCLVREGEIKKEVSLPTVRAKLEELAQYVYELIVVFEKDNLGEPYELLKRLLSEQCEVTRSSDEKPPKVEVKEKSEGATLRSPYDPDASYG